jgi:hypothetical protein
MAVVLLLKISVFTMPRQAPCATISPGEQLPSEQECSAILVRADGAGGTKAFLAHVGSPRSSA